MLKRTIDFILALFGLIVLSPFLMVACIAIFLQDFHSPFYIAPRMGQGEKMFSMVKLRSMVVNADKTGVDSTSSSDQRITNVGKIIRKFKLDELAQLWNVLKGDMSLVGPRPNVKRETDLYTLDEKRMFEIKPGITDLASVVFADVGDILKDSLNPDIDYNQLIRPWKSRLALFYRDHRHLKMDFLIILATILNITSRSKALRLIQNILKNNLAPAELISVAGRHNPLKPTAPPGSDQIVTHR